MRNDAHSVTLAGFLFEGLSVVKADCAPSPKHKLLS
jgi:hypothetical protein